MKFETILSLAAEIKNSDWPGLLQDLLSLVVVCAFVGLVFFFCVVVAPDLHP